MDLSQKHCVPCEGGTPPLPEQDEDGYLKELSGWSLVREGIHKLTKEIKFPTYADGVHFADSVAALADSENHHPDIHVYYKRVVIELHTHAVLGLSANDFILAAKIDRINA